jgi:hypothetical protein
VTPFVTRPLDNSRAEQLLNVRVSRVMDMIADWDGVRRVRVPMSSGIFLIRGNEPPIEMSQLEPETEAVLQDLLANYPSLLAGSAIDAANPRRWILVAQEMGVGSEGGGGARWAVDHLFIDQDAVPTLVEVKRSSDTRIRREVVGQLIEYAANGVVYWPIERIRERFDANCELKGIDPEAFLLEELGNVNDIEGFWLRVKENLETGRIRMLFVGDFIPPELQRMVEFLNEQMSKAEVLAVELRHYAAGDTRTLVPRVFGATIKARQQRKASDWSLERFIDEFATRHGEAASVAVGRLVDWGEAWGLMVSVDGSGLYLGLNWRRTLYWPLRIVLDGQVIVNFQALKKRPPFVEEVPRKELLERLKAVPGVDVEGSPITAKLDMSLVGIESAKGVDSLVDAFAWMFSEIKAI